MIPVVMDQNAHEFFLERFVKIYPFSHCVWRIPEAVAQASFAPFQGPFFDLGCGDGSYLQIFFDQVGRPSGEVYGLDPQEKELIKAEKRKMYTKVFHGTSSSIPLSDASVQTAFSNSVVEHIPDKDGTIREIARILRPGGRYLFSAPSQNFDAHFRIRAWVDRLFGARAAQAWVDLINKKFKHHWIQSPEQWEKDLSRHGLMMRSFRYTLSPENAALWERFLLPSFVQHIPAKRFDWVPCSAWSRRALMRRISQLAEPVDLADGGSVVILAEKI